MQRHRTLQYGYVESQLHNWYKSLATCWSENKVNKINDNQKKSANTIYIISRYTARSCMKQSISVVRYIIHVLGYNYSYHYNHSDIKFNLSL